MLIDHANISTKDHFRTFIYDRSFLERNYTAQEEKKTSEPGWGGYGGGRVSTRAEVQMGTIRQKPNYVLTVLEYRIDPFKSQ